MKKKNTKKHNKGQYFKSNKGNTYYHCFNLIFQILFELHSWEKCGTVGRMETINISHAAYLANVSYDIGNGWQPDMSPEKEICQDAIALGHVPE
jgi:hypothetical protein